MARDYSKYLTWIRQEFLPLTLATPELTLKQIYENAVRFWNQNSAYKLGTMVDYATLTKRVQLNPAFKTVVDIYPSKTTTWIKVQVHEKAAQFGKPLINIRKYRARLRFFGSNGVTTTSREAIHGATAADLMVDGIVWTARRRAETSRKSRPPTIRVIKQQRRWNDHQCGGFAGRPASKNSVNCGNIRESQTTRRTAVTMFGCGQSATKPFAAAA